VRAAFGSDVGETVQAFDRLSADSKYTRFMVHKKRLHPATLERGLHSAPGRASGVVATVPASDGIDIVGAAQYAWANANDNDNDNDDDNANDDDDDDDGACE